MFRCIVASDCTEENGRPIFWNISKHYGWGFAAIYCAVVIFMTFGLFNVIVAIFVENVVAASKFSEQVAKRERLRDQIFFANRIRELVGMLCWTQQGSFLEGT